MIRRLWSGIAGGLLAGTVVGLGEALFILSDSPTGEYVALVYAAVLYALIGAAMGAGVGFGLVVVGLAYKGLSDALAYTLGFLGVFVPLGLVITRYIVNKAVYGEGGVPLPAMLGILAAFGAASGLALWLGPVLLTRTPLKVVPQAKGTAALYAGIAGLAALFSFAPGTGSSGGLSFDSPQTEANPKAPDIVMVVVDTLRADHLGLYGNSDATSPNIDKLAGESVVFDQYITSASWTRASFASLYTSMLPSGHKCVLKAEKLPDDVETIAEVLKEAGYVTGGMPNNINVTQSFNFQQGFDFFEYQKPSYIAGATESAAQLSMYNVLRKVRDKLAGENRRVQDYYQPAETVLGRARQFVEANRSNNQRYFLVVHLMEPHDPYFEHPYNGSAIGRAWYPNPKPEEAEKLNGLYKDEIRWMDAELGKFMDWMKAEGAWDDTLFVLTADHGEEFNEHGGWWHGITLYDEQVHVPLVMKLPDGDRAGQRVPWQVRQIDVSPTLALYAGAKAPGLWQGSFLLDGDASSALDALNAPPLAAEPAEPGEGEEETAEAADTADTAAPAVDVGALERVAVAEQNFEGNVLSAIRKGGWKYLRANEGNPRGLETEELYHLAEDGSEQNNLAGQNGAVQSALVQEMDQVIQAAAENEIETMEGDGPSCEECQALYNLGYVDNCDAACGGG